MSLSLFLSLSLSPSRSLVRRRGSSRVELGFSRRSSGDSHFLKFGKALSRSFICLGKLLFDDAVEGGIEREQSRKERWRTFAVFTSAPVGDAAACIAALFRQYLTSEKEVGWEGPSAAAGPEKETQPDGTDTQSPFYTTRPRVISVSTPPNKALSRFLRYR